MLLWNKNQHIHKGAQQLLNLNILSSWLFFAKCGTVTIVRQTFSPTVLINPLLRWALTCNKLPSLAAFTFFLCTAGLRPQYGAEAGWVLLSHTLANLSSVLASPSSSNNSVLSCRKLARASCHRRCIACTWSTEIWDLQLHFKQENKAYTPASSLQAAGKVINSAWLACNPVENVKGASATPCVIFGWIPLLVWFVLPCEVRLQLIPGWFLPLKKKIYHLSGMVTMIILIKIILILYQ